MGTLGAEPRFLTGGRIADELGDTAPTPDTAYDIASLTKVVATRPLVCRALDTHRMGRTAPVRATSTAATSSSAWPSPTPTSAPSTSSAASCGRTRA